MITKTRARLIYILLVWLSSSCSNEEVTKNILHEYTQLEEGNYWVYDIYQINPDGSEVLTGKQDSTIVVGKTTYKGQEFIMLERTSYFTDTRYRMLLRDSIGYLIDKYGSILVADGAKNESSELPPKYEIHDGDTLSVTYYVQENTNTFQVPFGSFPGKTMKGEVYNLITDPERSNPRFTYIHFSSGLGKVLERYFLLNDSKIYEERLVRKGSI